MHGLALAFGEPTMEGQGQCHISIKYYYEQRRVLVSSDRRGMTAYGPFRPGIALTSGVARLSHSHASHTLLKINRVRTFQLYRTILQALSPSIQLDSWRHTRTAGNGGQLQLTWVTTTNSFPAGRLHVHEDCHCAATSAPSEKDSSKSESETINEEEMSFLRSSHYKQANG